MVSARPDTFEIEIETWEGPALSARLAGPAISFRHQRYGSELLVEPSDAAWGKFLDALDRLDIWAWNPEYSNRSVLDGTSWRIEIAARGRRIRARGSNGYPGQPLDCANPSETFKDFQDAVRELLFDDSNSQPLQPT